MLNDLVDLSLVYGDQNPMDLSIQLFTAIALAFVVRYYYIKFAAPIGNLGNIGNVLPMLSIITFLVILIVKTSLALSLGLVGALSIVRFRAPIKEPMELTFIFIAIAIGLGTGAGKHMITAVVILLLIAIDFTRIKLSKKEIQTKTLLIDVTNPSSPQVMDKLLNMLHEVLGSVRLSRVELGEENLTIVAHIDLSEQSKLQTIFARINDIDEKATATLFDNKPVW